MKPIDVSIISAAVLFVLVIASGFWVSKSGRPLNTGIFTIHKLIALAALVLMVVIVRALAKGIALNPVMIISIVLTFVFFVTMFATGAVLSFEKPAPDMVKLIHKIVPYLTMASSAVSVFLLKN